MKIDIEIKKLLEEVTTFTDEEKAVIVRTGVNITALSALKLAGQDVDEDIRMAQSILLDFGAEKALVAQTFLHNAYFQLIGSLTAAVVTRL